MNELVIAGRKAIVETADLQDPRRDLRFCSLSRAST